MHNDPVRIRLLSLAADGVVQRLGKANSGLIVIDFWLTEEFVGQTDLLGIFEEFAQAADLPRAHTGPDGSQFFHLAILVSFLILPQDTEDDLAVVHLGRGGSGSRGTPQLGLQGFDLSLGRTRKLAVGIPAQKIPVRAELICAPGPPPSGALFGAQLG